ncbi:MAG: methyltransferase protein [Chitinophagaceae bacterium]|nr:methyltransferase protein [Chitinophagaceae bacterium]
MNTAGNTHEQIVEQAFSKQSLIFDDVYSSDPIIQYKRKRVRDHVLTYVRPGDHMLELNSGTGEDAIFFASQNLYVHATDVSSGMQQQLVQKVQLKGMDDRISNEQCSFTNLAALKNRGPYDIIFSNFAGLNCTGELDKVLLSFDPLLKQNGLVTLVIMPPFCLWEFLLLFKGKFRTAFRRLFSSNGSDAHVEGEYFRCWYYKPSFITKNLNTNFTVVKTEGLCTIVPPSYIGNFTRRYPKIYSVLQKAEERLKSEWPWRFIGDYYIITLKKN